MARLAVENNLTLTGLDGKMDRQKKTEPDFTRLRATLTRERLPDRLPIADGVDPEIKEEFLGTPIRDLKTYVRFRLEAGYDYAVLQIRGQPLADSTQIKISKGILRAHTGESHAAGAVSGIHDWKSFEAYPWIGAESAYYRDVDEASECMPDGMKLIVNVGPIFSGTWRCMGMETFSIACLEQPELVKAIVENMGTVIVKIVEQTIQRDYVGGIWLGDDIAYTESLMVSPNFLRKHIFPFYKQIGHLCRKHDKVFIFHSDGTLKEVFEDLIACGIQAIHPNEPAAMDIVEVKRQWGHKVSLIGNVDVDLLTRGTPEQVAQATRYLIDNVAPGGGYALGSGHSVTKHVPMLNYRAMLDTVREFGAIY